MFPTWDEGLGMLYVVGRGDSSVKYWEYQDGKLHFINAFNSTTPGKVSFLFNSKGIRFLPKTRC